MSERSLILYDFINSNDLMVGNFITRQSINYTYAKGAQRTYIDHVLIPRHMRNLLQQCTIQQHWDNATDHFAIVTKLNIDIDQCPSYNANFVYPRTQWNDPGFCDMYINNVQHILRDQSGINPDLIPDHQAQLSIDKLYNKLCTAMHSAVEMCIVNRSQPRQKHWWTRGCTDAKARNRFWHSLWVENGKPTHGAVHDCYKESKRNFRKICRISQSDSIGREYRIINIFMKHRNINKLWASVKRLKNNNHEIQVTKEDLREYFGKKFQDTVLDHSSARTNVAEYFTNSSVDRNYVFPETLVKKYIQRLKASAAPGIDGITAHHLKQAMDSDLTLHLAALFTLCCRHSIVPEAFTCGLLVPIPKPGKDPSSPDGYRPITISVTASKILEYYILDQCSGYEYNPLMFGYIQERGTDMAIALAHDVCQYSLARGSPVYLASLDAAGAFDHIPHAVLFNKTRDVIPLISWKMLVHWYSRSKARIMIGRHVDGTDIPIRRGMRQGSLTSPMLFNMFYRDLIETLANQTNGVIINKRSYNIFNYADDILLASLTVSGLQALIDKAVGIITRDGLQFNPEKTICNTFGPNVYTSAPTWYINGIPLTNKDHIKYLGATISSKGGTVHIQERIRAAQRSYYSLQGAGLHKNGLDPTTSAFLHRSVISPSLSYGCNAIHLNRQNTQDLYSCQGKLLKSNLGLYNTSLTSPLLNSLRITPVTAIIEKETADLLFRCIKSNSAARTFYTQQMQLSTPYTARTLLARCQTLCDRLSTSIHNIIFSKNTVFNYAFYRDGITDSLTDVFSNFTHDNRVLAQLLVNSF